MMFVPFDDEKSPISIFVSYILVPIIMYIIAKTMLSLAIPWWCVIFVPIWFFVASLLPGGFIITNIILAVFDIMHVTWWAWVLAGLASIWRIAWSTALDDDILI